MNSDSRFEWKGGKTIEFNRLKPLIFRGESMEYFKIWIVNVLLTVVTLGLYYPWAKVRTNRYLYANTTFNGRNFDYHATGKQLFLGYVVAMGLFIAYIILGEVSPEASIILPIILFIAVPWIIWRSLKFGMRMTSFSNVHFSFNDTVKQSYINFFVYPFLLMLALYTVPIMMFVLPLLSEDYGIDFSWILAYAPFLIIISFILASCIYAVMKRKNTSYIINGTGYGQGVFHTQVEAKKFWFIAFKSVFLFIFVNLFVLAIVGTIAYYTMGMGIFQEIEQMINDDKLDQLPMMLASLLPLLSAAYMGMLISMIIVISYIVTRQRTYVLGNTTLDKKIKFASTLKARSLSWVSVTNLLAIIFSLGLAYPWAKIRMTKLMARHTCIDAGTDINAYITQQQQIGSSLGDQIGDAFDVDVGLGF